MILKAINKIPVTTAVLLAAGRGKRLKPHTDTTPKPLLPVQGIPTLDLYCNSCKAAGITDVILVANYLAEQIIDYGNTVHERFGMQCTTVIQQRLDGTATALESASKADISVTSRSILHNSFLLMATDYLIPTSFIPDLLSFHASHNADISVSLKTVPQHELSSRSSVRINHDGDITEVVEKPEAGKAPSNLSANLAYVLPADLLNYLPSVKPSARGERELQTAINAYLAKEGTARGIVQTAPAEWDPTVQ